MAMNRSFPETSLIFLQDTPQAGAELKDLFLQRAFGQPAGKPPSRVSGMRHLHLEGFQCGALRKAVVGNTVK